MPILYIEPPPPPPAPPEPVRRIPDPQCKKIIWTSPNGEVVEFGVHPLSMIPGRQGFGRVQHEIISDRIRDGGNFVQNYRPGVRVLTLPFQIKTNDLQLMSDTYNLLDRAFQHRDHSGLLGPGEVRVIRWDGTSRTIRAYYQNGFDGSEDIDDQVVGHQTFPNLELWCPDPMWESDEVNLAWRASPPAGRYFYPIYPVTLRGSDISDVRNFVNNSVEPIYPIWEFTGPGTPYMKELSSGLEFEFLDEVQNGQTIRVDTRPISIAPETGMTAYDVDTGENWTHKITGTWFSLPRGPVQIEFTMNGATDDSILRLRYRERHGRAW
jgi:hypothetical protein